ncbi:MAG TPA: threonine/serine dehydratase, partial [Roseiarcus sp.]|nr:threonine/serine dehydratase [Roseiarcus sp.]
PSKRVTLKLEFLQHAGSFKPRGAFNNLLSVSPPPAGVATASGGNHGEAVAYAAGKLGVKARIFVPEIAPPVKIAKIKASGAEVVVKGATYFDALALCDAYVAESGALSIHAYDSARTIEGQGTVGLEWEEELSRLDLPKLDTVLVAVGGGGLIAGIAAWFAGKVKVIAVEPEGSRALHEALAAGRPVDVPVRSIAADSLGARRVGDIVYEIARQAVAASVLVSDDAIRAAQQALWRDFCIIAEPGGAAAYGALMSGAYRPAANERIGVLLCGGNADFSTLTAER